MNPAPEDLNRLTANTMSMFAMTYFMSFIDSHHISITEPTQKRLKIHLLC